MTTSIDHVTFTLSRRFSASPVRVWQAFPRFDEKRKWFVETSGFITYDYRLEYREWGAKNSSTAPHRTAPRSPTRHAMSRLPQKNASC